MLNGTCYLATIIGTNKLVPYHLTSPCNSFHLFVTLLSLHASCSHWRWSGITTVPAMATRWLAAVLFSDLPRTYMKLWFSQIPGQIRQSLIPKSNCCVHQSFICNIDGLAQDCSNTMGSVLLTWINFNLDTFPVKYELTYPQQTSTITFGNG